MEGCHVLAGRVSAECQLRLVLVSLGGSTGLREMPSGDRVVAVIQDNKRGECPRARLVRRGRWQGVRIRDELIASGKPGG